MSIDDPKHVQFLSSVLHKATGDRRYCMGCHKDITDQIKMVAR